MRTDPVGWQTPQRDVPSFCQPKRSCARAMCNLHKGRVYCQLPWCPMLLLLCPVQSSYSNKNLSHTWTYIGVPLTRKKNAVPLQERKSKHIWHLWWTNIKYAWWHICIILIFFNNFVLNFALSVLLYCQHAFDHLYCYHGNSEVLHLSLERIYSSPTFVETKHLLSQRQIDNQSLYINFPPE